MRANCLLTLTLAFLASATLEGSLIVVSNNSPGDDFFTNPLGTAQGQAVGTSGWYYNNVRNSGGVGISSLLPWNATGSVYFSSPSGAAKADIEYLPGAINLGGNYLAAGSLGRFADLQSLSYRWYRVGSSTVAPHLHPVIRILLDADGDLSTLGDRGGLVFERIYVEPPGWTAPVNVWVPETIGPGTYLWNFGLGIGLAANINDTSYPYDATLAQWQTYFPNAVIIGFNAGVGSGWNGSFTGGVDDISWTLGGASTTTNFEVYRVSEIPEPRTGLLAAAVVALIALHRRRPRAVWSQSPPSGVATQHFSFARRTHRHSSFLSGRSARRTGSPTRSDMLPSWAV
ncbi:MAG: hypothetical protein ACPL88_06180 [Bryobacteraceae bacterium]